MLHEPRSRIDTLRDQKGLNPQSTAQTNPALEDDDEIDLAQLAGTLWRGKWLILLATVIFLSAGAYYAYSVAVPKFRATTVVMMENQKSQIMPSFDSVVSGLSGDQSSVNTEVQILQSRSLAEKVVKKLDLTNDPEFNVRLRKKSPYSLSGAVAFLRNDILGMAPNDPVPSARQVLDETVNLALAATSISNVRQSLAFNITITSEDPQKAAQIADTTAELYISDQIEVKRKATASAAKWLGEKVGELKVELETAEATVERFSTKSDLISSAALLILNRQLKDLRDRLTEARKSKASLQAQRVTLKAEAANSPQDATALASMAAVRADLARATSQVAALQTSLTTLGADVNTQSADFVKLQQLKREAEATGVIYQTFLGRLKETTVQLGIQQADSRILSNSVVPPDPSEPRKAMILALAAILGLIVGSGLVILREMRHSGFRTADQLESATGITVMGQIPQMPIRRREQLLGYLQSKPASASAEAIRNLRTSVLLSNVDSPPKVIMFTSSLPGEGKTTVSVATAQNFAGLGKKVLLIDGDIRRLTLAEYFELPQTGGLMSVVSGETELKDAVQRREGLNIDILLGEKTQVNAADLFSSDRFVNFLAKARDEYDVILIDTPPVLVVPDARVIGQSADAILYVVHWDETGSAQVKDGLRMFAQVNLAVSGLILSQVDAKGMRKYGYGGSYGSYGGYYDV